MSAGLDTRDMTSATDENHPFQPRLVGTTGHFYQGRIAETAVQEGTLSNYGPRSSPDSTQRSQPRNEHHHFKSAQWSPDGTTILTSSADNTLRSFILPPDLLSPPHPKTLEPYALHHPPEPIYATTFHPSYNLQEPSTCLALASPRSLPLRLFSPFAADRILASYPLVSPTTETWIAPHSLLFSPQEAHSFFAGSESCVSVFDANRDGEGPVTKMHTTPSRRGGAVGQGQGMKGIVSALGMSSEGMLAAGTYSRWVGLYDGFGRGGNAGVFPVATEDEIARGGGITLVVWSACGRYLCVVERASDGVGVWDVRGTGKTLAWLRGRNAGTQQRLGVEVVGGEVWAGALDGVVRVWEGLGMAEGVVDPSWGFRAHGDAVSSTTLHPTGPVLATCSGQRHSFSPVRAVGDLDSESDSDSSSFKSSLIDSQSSTNASSRRPPQATDNSLKLWAL
ncbi:hypothetical protein IMSHALPRED_003743 [Imshaugia aleurites]|uniref:Uncharacterized protein n=1 Tax=Imshaugia aleurites TaxID=172621 RepID=A0A8H3F1X9_9LECA|nr:hypothetical protein IMSHALPRED_003743 [Imshaugia aleurites]